MTTDSASSLKASRPNSATPRDVLSHGISQNARERGDAVALIAAGECLNYRELDALVSIRVYELQCADVKAGAHIGVYADRSPGAIVTLLAIMRLGAVYVPLNARMPAARLAGFVESSGISVVVSIAEPPMTVDTARVRSLTMPMLPALTDNRSISPPQQSDSFKPSAAAYIIQTSGTTGASKPVLVGRDSLRAHIAAIIDHFGLAKDDRVLHICAPSFDVSIEELLPTLSAGGSVVIAPDPQAEGIDAIDQCIRSTAVTVLNLPTALWSAWLDYLTAADLPLPASLRLVVVGGEACPAVRAQEWRSRFGEGIPCLNGYGLTETTITNSCWPLSAYAGGASGAVPVGYPLAGNRLLVLDQDQNEVARGEPGELFIGGAFVAQGYFNAPRETASRFVPDPFSQTPGARLFRTGDRAWIDDSGAVVVGGRVDRQIKLHGYRIELAEIEYRLTQIQGIAFAYVCLSHAAGNEALLAYLQVARDFVVERNVFLGRSSNPALRACVSELQQQLPLYMVPSIYCFLDAIPLNANAKVDTRALPQPPADHDTGDFSIDVSTEADARLTALSKALGFRPSDLDASFYDVGGDSVIALKLISTLRATGYLLELRDLMSAPSLRAVLMACKPLASDPGEGKPRNAFITAVKLSKPELQQLHANAALWREIEFICGPTPMQTEMLAHSLRYPRSGYCIEQVEGVLNDLDVPTFKSAWAEVVQRHEALRSYFSFKLVDKPLLICNKQALLTWRESSWAERSPHDWPALIQQYLQADRREEFALLTAPLFRWHLIKLHGRDYHFVWTYHHALLDGWSDVMILGEVFDIYNAKRSGQPCQLPPSHSYRDYAKWLSQQDRDRSIGFWQTYLEGIDSHRPWLLANDNPGIRRLSMQAIEEQLPQESTSQLTETARRLGVPLSTLFTAVFGLCLAIERRCSRVAFGQFIWVRPAELADLNGTAGLFINLVPVLVARPEGADLKGWLRTLLDFQIERDRHIHLGSSEILSCAEVTEKPLFDAAVIVENYPEAADPAVAMLRTHAQSSIPLNAFFWPGARLRVEIKFNSDLVQPDVALRLLAGMQALLLALSSSKSLPQLPLASIELDL